MDLTLNNAVMGVELSGIRQFTYLVRDTPGACALTIGEPDLNTPDAIKEAAKAALDANDTHYPPGNGFPYLLEAVSKFGAEHHGLHYAPNEIIMTVGATEALFAAFSTVLNPGDEVIIPTPAFSLYESITRLCRGVPVALPTEDNAFQIDLEKLKAAITPKTKAMILNNPSNPTGMMYSRKELEEIAKVCVEQDIYVICDEIYYHLVYDGEEFVSLASISPEIKERTLLVNGVSKSYAMTGWRIGYVAANNQVSKVIANYLSHCTGSPSSISQKAAVTALTASQESVEVMRKAFERRRDYMVERMNSIEGVSCIKPHGAFYVMMNIEKLIGQELHGVVIRDADDFGNLFLKYGKVAVVPGTGFGAPTFVRWSYATSIENIKEGLNRLERFLKGETI